MADVPACLSFSDLKDSYPADFESEYGPNDPSRELVRQARRVVVKVRCSAGQLLPMSSVRTLHLG